MKHTAEAWVSMKSSVKDRGVDRAPRRWVAVVSEPFNDRKKSPEETVEAPAARQRTKAAERMRRHRARRKRKCRIVSVEVADFDIAGLVWLGHLDERDRGDAVANWGCGVPVVRSGDCQQLKCLASLVGRAVEYGGSPMRY